jgi:putative restriction endonuclease
MELAREQAVREALFLHLDSLLVESYDGNLSWEQTASFEFVGESFSIRQTRGRGINKPANLSAALSITTAFTPFGREPPYEDSVGNDGHPRYKYEGTEPAHASNRALRLCLEFQLPLAYFIGVDRGLYRPLYPVYLLAENSQRHEFTVGLDATEVGIDLENLTPAQRRYALRETKTRIHQPIFRQRVLHAYAGACAICRLRHVELLDAAHIISDSKPLGEPVVPNGIALCKIHHAAFDRNFLGIRPDYGIVINAKLLDEVDGPMLKHGLQEMNGGSLMLPRSKPSRPDPERLEVKYDEFQKAS